MHHDLKPGLQHVQRMRVSETLTVPAMTSSFGSFADMPPVFATAYMVAFIEFACVEFLKRYLDDGEGSVGTHVDVSHTAATPIGMEVTAEVELVAVEGRKLRFQVTCRDEADEIGKGFHERFIIDRAKFMNRVEAKAAKTSAS
jgi:fluoroacetyl-CoA thioesterase